MSHKANDIQVDNIKDDLPESMWMKTEPWHKGQIKKIYHKVVDPYKTLQGNDPRYDSKPEI